MSNNEIAELLERAENMLETLNERHEEDESDTIGYPHMQNICLMMQTIAQLHQAANLLALDQDVQYIMRQLDGFRMTGFPVEEISK